MKRIYDNHTPQNDLNEEPLEVVSDSGSSFIRGLFDFVIIIVLAFFLTWGIRTFVVQAYEIPTGSMEDTIQIGDRVFSEKITYYFTEVQQGDIVTFTDPTGSGETLIKRVIAVGGQTVDLQDGFVYVDGEKLEEPYTEGKESVELTSTYRNEEIGFPYTVPEGSIWVMGDNRTNSSDSRYFGAVPLENVSGHAVFIYWPIASLGILQ